VAPLTDHLRRMGSDESDIAECAAQSYEEIVVGLDREMSLRDSGIVPAGRVNDVQYRDFVNDPRTTIKDIYQRLGRELRPETAQKMRDFLAPPGRRSLLPGQTQDQLRDDVQLDFPRSAADQLGGQVQVRLHDRRI
jgi:hypothetical protein